MFLLDEFSLKFVLGEGGKFTKLCSENSILVKTGQIRDTLHEDLRTFMTTWVTVITMVAVDSRVIGNHCKSITICLFLRGI